MAEDRHGGSDDRRPRRASGDSPRVGGNSANRSGANGVQRSGTSGGPRRGGGDRPKPPWSSTPDRARRDQRGGDDADPRLAGPSIPASIEAKQLAPDIRSELITLDKSTADVVARHLVAAGELLEDDPAAALEHARAARARSGRIAAVREAVGIAAYYCGDWAQALAELRAARRMGSKSALLPLIADCERGVGRPERAVELARSEEALLLTGDDADELRIVVAGARSDLGQHEQALAVLSNPPLDATRLGQTSARLFYAYAETLLALGRSDESVQAFINAAATDIEGVTDAEERLAELS
ncbi:MAG: tetratricopeptide repeat protein [Mycobacterium sp.]